MNANILVAKKWYIPFFSERKVARENFRLSFTQTYIILGVLVTLFTGYYTLLTNQNATKWYSIRSLQMTWRELAFKENLLDIRIAEGKSIDVVMSQDIVGKMEDITAPAFLVLKDTHFTMN